MLRQLDQGVGSNVILVSRSREVYAYRGLVLLTADICLYSGGIMQNVLRFFVGRRGDDVVFLFIFSSSRDVAQTERRPTTTETIMLVDVLSAFRSVLPLPS